MKSLKQILNYIVALLLLVALVGCSDEQDRDPAQNAYEVKVGAWYFGGWSFPADANGFTFHISPTLVGSYGERAPIWGWREDSAEIMSKQIDYAANAKLSWWGFCWYENTLVDDAPLMDNLNNALDLFLQSPNKDRLEFCLLSCHPVSSVNWSSVCTKTINYFKQSNYLKVDGKPVIVFFNADQVVSGMGGASGIQSAFATYRQMARDAGVGEIMIGACTQRLDDNSIYEEYGFDFLTTYNNADIGREQVGANDYSALARGDIKSWGIAKTSNLPFLPTLTAGYDMRPWAQDHPAQAASDFWYTGTNYKTISMHMRDLFEWQEQNQGKSLSNLSVIYAWNELGEGAWLTPSYGEANARLEYIRYMIEQQNSGR